MKKILYAIAFILILLNTSAWATTITRYVDTVNGTDTGGSSGCAGTGASACATLNYVLTQNEQNLVTNTSNLVINCVGNGTVESTGGINLTSYTTSATYNITINGNNQTGIWGTQYYTIQGTGYNVPAFQTGVNYVTMNYIQITYTAGGSGEGYAVHFSGSSNIANALIIQGSLGGSVGDGGGISIESSGGYGSNILAYSNAGSGIALGSTSYCYNCTYI